MKDTGNDLNNAVLLGHETYRDGIVDSGNTAETINAVIAHTSMAANMESWGADVNLNGLLGLETAAYKSGNNQLLEAIAENCYDSSADYWKMQVNADGSHRIIYDGKKELSIDYLDEDGNVISTMTPDGQNMSGVGMAGALAKILGTDRAEEILGSSYLNADNYDSQTLADVLSKNGYAAEDIIRIQRRGSLAGVTLSDSDKYSLLGEALMKNTGAFWSGSWENTGNIAYTITDAFVGGGYMMGEVSADGKYLYSSVTATVYRDPDSWNSVTSTDGVNWQNNDEYAHMDTTVYQKKGINYDYYDSFTVMSEQTVDNMFKSLSNPSLNYNQPYYAFGQGWVQGNTVSSSDYNMEYISSSGSFEGAVLVKNRAYTISGNFINNKGQGGVDANRWLEHANKGSSKSSDYNTYRSDGCDIVSYNSQTALLEKLQSWQLRNGYQIRTHLENRKY
jgi:hypothetical protein